jgi:hypothetical protein
LDIAPPVSTKLCTRAMNDDAAKKGRGQMRRWDLLNLKQTALAQSRNESVAMFK